MHHQKIQFLKGEVCLKKPAMDGEAGMSKRPVEILMTTAAAAAANLTLMVGRIGGKRASTLHTTILAKAL